MASFNQGIESIASYFTPYNLVRNRAFILGRKKDAKTFLSKFSFSGEVESQLKKIAQKGYFVKDNGVHTIGYFDTKKMTKKNLYFIKL